MSIVCPLHTNDAMHACIVTLGRHALERTLNSCSRAFIFRSSYAYQKDLRLLMWTINEAIVGRLCVWSSAFNNVTDHAQFKDQTN